MGTKLQFAINPLAASSSSNNLFLANQLSDCGGYPLKIGPSKLSQSCSVSYFNPLVHEMFDLQNIESIKKTMLMQDDIFKLQVRELHQLYQRQMELMYELKNENATNMKKGGNRSGFTAIWNQPIKDIKSDLPVYTLRGEEDPPLELSASCSGESPRMPKGFNLEQQQCPSTSENNQKKGLSSSRLLRTDDDDRPDEEIDVELTLSIGCGRNKKALNSKVNQYYRRELLLGSSDSNYCGRNHPSTLIIKRERTQDKDDSGHAVSSSSSAKLNQNSTTAPSNWFFQDLSLNRT